MMKKPISTILVFCVFISVAGFTIPCTLHCLNMETGMEMCQHEASSEMDCDGSCMVKKVSDRKSDQNKQDPDSSLLTQYRVNLLAPKTGISNTLINPPSIESYFNPFHALMYSLWIADPLVPPPKYS